MIDSKVSWNKSYLINVKQSGALCIEPVEFKVYHAGY